MTLNEQAGQLIARSAAEAQRLAGAARVSARGRGAQTKLRAAQKLEQLAGRCRRVAEQIDRRARNLKITDRLVSLADPDARPSGIRPREIVVDGGFMASPTHDAFPELKEHQIQISGRHEPGSRRTRKRRARYRTGIDGRINHLKRRYGMRRSRLKGDDGMKIWTGWAILAYDLDTLAIRTR